MVKVPPLQIVADCAEIIGMGLIVTVTTNVLPKQFNPAFGVTVYCAVCATLVGLFNVCDIVPWLLAAVPPAKFPVTIGVDQE